ncbi:uncharacterized protein LOC6646400 [Drosophila willistoni]|uniref:uncharacterized protein LOC6646400 n=1 Tax=Drosophila willistoni TaxID=7260 RepID=UPI001F07F0C0|nr:uncharacterized protein LOC6646400 [Drosophila willistoni]
MTTPITNAQCVGGDIISYITAQIGVESTNTSKTNTTNTTTTTTTTSSTTTFISGNHPMLHTRFLYTYEPYPSIRIHLVHHLKDYYKLTRLRNLHGQEIRFTVESNSPRVFKYINRHGKLVYAGYFYELIHQFIGYYNGTEIKVHENMEVVPLGDYMPYPELNVLNLTDTEQYYQRTRALLWNFHGYAINCGVVMVGAPRAFMYRDDKNNDIYAGYMLNMVLAFIAHHNGTIRTRPVYTLKEAYDSLSNPGFMLTNLYLAQLSTSLAAGLYEKQVNTFDDLPGTDLTLPVIETEIKHFHQLPDIHPELASRMIVTSELLVDIYRRQLNTSYLHCGYEDRIDFALYQQKFLRPPLFHKLTKIVDQQPFQIPIRYGLPYLQIFNRYMRRAFEGGIWLKLRTDSFADGIRSGQLHFFNGARYMKRGLRVCSYNVNGPDDDDDNDNDDNSEEEVNEDDENDDDEDSEDENDDDYDGWTDGWMDEWLVR